MEAIQFLLARVLPKGRLGKDVLMGASPQDRPLLVRLPLPLREQAEQLAAAQGLSLDSFIEAAITELVRTLQHARETEPPGPSG